MPALTINEAMVFVRDNATMKAVEKSGGLDGGTIALIAVPIILLVIVGMMFVATRYP